MNKNFNKKNYLIIGVIFTTCFFFLPFTVKAVTSVYFDLDKPTFYKDDIFLLNLKISSPDKSINVIDGTLIYDKDKLEIKEISTGGSLFTLWPKPPIFSNEKGSVSFVGGVSRGFKGEIGEVLKIVFLAKGEGEAKIDFLDGFLVFLDNGQGTSISPWLNPILLNISKRSAQLPVPVKDEWRDLVDKDEILPEFIEAVISNDPRIFDNQYFVSFLAIDEDSGVAYYEIKEDDLNFVRTESPYLLQDQSLGSTIQIKAVDKSGNERIITISVLSTLESFYKTYLIWVLGVLLGLTLIFALWRLIQAKLK